MTMQKKGERCHRSPLLESRSMVYAFFIDKNPNEEYTLIGF